MGGDSRIDSPKSIISITTRGRADRLDSLKNINIISKGAADTLNSPKSMGELEGLTQQNKFNIISKRGACWCNS